MPAGSSTASRVRSARFPVWPIFLLVVAVEVAAPSHMHAGFVEDNTDEWSPLLSQLVLEEIGFEQLKRRAGVSRDKKIDEDRKKIDEERKRGGNRHLPAKKTTKSTSRAFVESLNDLMSKLEETEHRYIICCLKPNHSLKAGRWDEELMLRQLSYSGMLEVCKVRKAGLNTRMPLSQFFPWFKIISAKPKMLRG